MWPVLWSTFFFGRRGAAWILACVGVAHAATLLSLPAVSSYPGRWIDVMVVVAVLAAVVLTLIKRNDELLARLADEARTDALTGLLNRRGFDERASVELARARREGDSLAIVAFDIDCFKCVNDEWGHDMGDRVLMQLGELLELESRDIDVTARIGGEEFVVLLPGADGAGAEGFAGRVRAALARLGSAELPRVRASAGIHAELAPLDIESMLQRADTALYVAKRGGRDRAISFGACADAPVASLRSLTTSGL
jgi:diguanylate cyclase (GGDEF)-like protein